MPKENENKKLTLSQSILIGSAVGVTGYTVNMPFWTTKTRIQAGLPFTFNPVVLYRGYTSIIVTMVPVTILQITFTSQIEKHIDSENTISSERRMLTSFLGGAAAAPFSNALTMTIAQQHKLEKASFPSTLKFIVHNYGPFRLTAGLPATMMAESFYVFAFYALAPWIKKNLYDEKQGNTFRVKISSGLIAGFISVLVTHIPDRIRTHKQISDPLKKVPTILESVKELCRKDGIHGFFRKGLAPRMVGGAMTTMATSIAAETLTERFISKQYTP